MKRLLPFLAIAAIVCSSCGIVRSRSSERYLPGPAIRADYTPEGIVEEHYHPCSVPGPTERHMVVYLPADYYQTERRYPVLYLLHGARGYETSWIRFGEVYHTADSLWAKGKAEPCIIVMPNINQYNDDEDYDGGRFKDAFESICEVDGVVESAFMNDVVDYIDSHYRTLTDQKHRAIAGLSIGGYQSIYLGANYPNEFGYIGAMSPYMWSMGHPSVTRHQFYSHLHKKMKRQFADNPPYGYYLYAGTTDMMRPSTVNLHQYMNKKGYEHTYKIYPETHDWPNGWTQELKDMMQNIFKD